MPKLNPLTAALKRKLRDDGAIRALIAFKRRIYDLDISKVSVEKVSLALDDEIEKLIEGDN